MPKDMVIRFEIEPIVNLKCVNGACAHNLAWAGAAACNLKHVLIGENGCCTEFVARSTEAQDKVAAADAGIGGASLTPSGKSMLGRAYQTAYARMRELNDPGWTSTAEKAFELHPHDGDAPEVIVYVKIIRFDPALLERDPDSGGLLADI